MESTDAHHPIQEVACHVASWSAGFEPASLITMWSSASLDLCIVAGAA